MPDTRIETTVKVVNRLGLHARPAMALVDVAMGFPCEITLTREGQSVNAKSVMEVLLLAATEGTDLTVVATGEQAQAAADAIVALVAEGFEED